MSYILCTHNLRCFKSIQLSIRNKYQKVPNTRTRTRTKGTNKKTQANQVDQKQIICHPASEWHVVPENYPIIYFTCPAKGTILKHWSKGPYWVKYRGVVSELCVYRYQKLIKFKRPLLVWINWIYLLLLFCYWIVHQIVSIPSDSRTELQLLYVYISTFSVHAPCSIGSSKGANNRNAFSAFL